MLGLLFFFMLTNRGSPLDINIKFVNGEIQHSMVIDSLLLDALTKDTDTILFIDLIKRMIKKVPDQRQTCEDLLKHVALKNEKGRLEIVQLMANKCFNADECINAYLVKVMDKKEVHMEGSLAEDSAEWKKLLAEVANFQTDIKKCSSLLKIFAVQVVLCFWMLPLNFYLIIVILESPRPTPDNHGCIAKLLPSHEQHLPRGIAQGRRAAI